jgi:integrase
MNKKLSDLLNEFIEYKNRNGYAYTTAKYHLNKYLAFSTSHAPDESIPSKDTVNTFLNRCAGTPGNLYNIAAALREFSRYLIGLGYTSAYIIPPGKISLPMPVQPYLFTDDELEAFFDACDSIKYDCHVPKRYMVLPAM